MSIDEISKLVKNVVEKEYPNKDQINIVKSSSDDNRSYHINSEKIKKVLGFEPKKSIEMAIKDLCDAFKQKKIINSFENDLYFNVSRLKNIKAK
jgi:nucleoside-diphosphate-sugar epimerase